MTLERKLLIELQKLLATSTEELFKFQDAVSTCNFAGEFYSVLKGRNFASLTEAAAFVRCANKAIDNLYRLDDRMSFKQLWDFALNESDMGVGYEVRYAWERISGICLALSEGS